MLNRMTRQLFIHIPRTGGTMLAHLTGWPLDIAHAWGLLQGLELTHLTAREFRELFGEDEFNSWERIAVVRNPFDRIASEYCYRCTQGFIPYMRFLDHWPTFLEFMQVLDQLKFHDKSAWPHWWKSHLHTQVQFVCDNDRQPLATVWKYEDLESHLRQHFNVSMPDRMNGSDRSKAVHDAETIDITQRYFRDDFEVFGY